MSIADYKPKYLNKSRSKKQKRRFNPENWVTGPDPILHDMYYAWLKHRSQAQYRGEQHNLTWSQWQNIWPLDIWLQRGRAQDSLVLARIDHLGPWDIDNCYVIARKEYLKRQGEFRRGLSDVQSRV